MQKIPKKNFPIDCQALHSEIIDLDTGTVWQSHLPMSRDIYDNLELPPALRKVGIGRGVMDQHYFRRSPQASVDGPVTEKVIAGHAFFHCANPPADGAEMPIPGGPALLRVDKHHSLVFHAGSELQLVTTEPGKTFIQVIAATPSGGGIMQKGSTDHVVSLPDGWQASSQTVSATTVIHLPHPTQAWFFADGASFQGPTDIPE